MAASDKLSDVQLRQELGSFGEEVGHITAVNRGILIKKLNHLRAAQKKAGKFNQNESEGRKLLGFSSDESEPETSSTAKHEVATKKVLSMSMVKKVTDSRTSSRRRRSDIGTFAVPSTSLTVKVPKKSRRSVGPVRTFDPQQTPPTKSTLAPPPSVVKSRSRTQEQSQDDHFSDTDIDQQNGYHDDVEATPNHDRSSRSSGTASSNDSKVRQRTMRSCDPGLSSGNHVTANSPSASTDNDVNLNGDESAHGPSSKFKSKHGEVSSVDDEMLRRVFKTSENNVDTRRGRYMAQYTSMLLLVVLCVFFTLLAMIYVYSWPSLPDSNRPDDVLPCPPGAVVESPDCVVISSDPGEVLSLVNVLYTLLSDRAGLYECSDSAQRYMTYTDVIKQLPKTASVKSETQVFEDLIKLCLVNTHWGILLKNGSGGLMTSPNDLKIGEVKLLETNRAARSFSCRFTQSFLSIIFKIISVILVMLIVIAVVRIVRYRRFKNEETQRSVYLMVDRIIDVMKKHSEKIQRDKDKEGVAYLAIPHVRDMLIVPADRKSMLPVWDKAIKFLAFSESRVRVESQCISGEEYVVWRWLPNLVISEHDLTFEGTGRKVKVWQGHAFQNVDSVANAPAYNFTPCLKIRNMFDTNVESSDNWEVNIKDSILEKCSDNNGIVHIAVDKTSKEGCVYMKCLSAEQAGKAYRSIHGCWFDGEFPHSYRRTYNTHTYTAGYCSVHSGKLVTVKYLRLDRYHYHFPDALTAKTVLVPSNDRMDSILLAPQVSALEST